MQINVEIQEEKIKKKVLSERQSVREILWKEKKSDHELEYTLKKRFGLNQIISKLLVSRGINTENFSKFSNPLLKNIMPESRHSLYLLHAYAFFLACFVCVRV